MWWSLIRWEKPISCKIVDLELGRLSKQVQSLGYSIRATGGGSLRHLVRVSVMSRRVTACARSEDDPRLCREPLAELIVEGGVQSGGTFV